MADDTDDTVRLRVPRAAAPGAARLLPWGAGAALLLAFAGGGAWWVLRPAPPEPPPAQAIAMAPPGAVIDKPSPPALAPRFPPAIAQPPLADEAQILADSPAELATYRFLQRPSIVVLQFPTLGEQALMLNRIAALTEKSGFPHAEVLPRDQLDARIIAGGSKPDSFYYGHDYSAAALVRFFALAADLNAQEARLQEMVRALGWQESGAVGALVSLVRQSSAPDLDETARTAILRHELSHGYYFTDPAYAEYCRRFWRDVMTGDERSKFVAFLAREGYDTTLSDLMVNETQAYLMHTPDKRFFNADAIGLRPARLAELRQIFIVGMPAGWLRDSTMADKL